MVTANIKPAGWSKKSVTAVAVMDDGLHPACHIIRTTVKASGKSFEETSRKKQKFRKILAMKINNGQIKTKKKRFRNNFQK